MSRYQGYQRNSQEASNNAPNNPGCSFDILCSTPDLKKIMHPRLIISSMPCYSDLLQYNCSYNIVTIEMKGSKLISKITVKEAKALNTHGNQCQAEGRG